MEAEGVPDVAATDLVNGLDPRRVVWVDERNTETEGLTISGADGQRKPAKQCRGLLIHTSNGLGDKNGRPIPIRILLDDSSL